MRSGRSVVATILISAAVAGWIGSSSISGRAQSAVSPARPPVVKVLTPPDFWGSSAIWGSTGFDGANRIWFGITSNDDKSGSAHLYELNAATDTFADVGNVVGELERLHLRKPGEIQMKIHSRIVRATDGFVYFASMDETGEEDDGSKLPTWGGHLWRRNGAGAWEHLLAAPEALVGVAGGGPFVYSLGYFNHVLYQFDTRSRRVRSVTVGAVNGHVSRNFFADERGHVFVPRVSRSGSQFAAALVEYDASLTEIGNQRLAQYFESTPDDSHGIVSVSPDDQGGWFFATAVGRLYHETPNASGPAVVVDLGWFHPAGARYVASMFRDSRTGALYGVAAPSHNGTPRFEWLTRAANGSTTVAPLPFGDAPQFPGNALLYGSITHDATGHFYVVGTMNYKPVVLKVTPAS